MAQAVIAYLIVAVAAAWVVWRVALPAAWQARLQALVRRGPAPPRDGCACGRD